MKPTAGRSRSSGGKTRKPITLGGQRKSDDGARQVSGDGTHGRWRHVNQGALLVERSVLHLPGQEG
jgi:hypothetical protein